MLTCMVSLVVLGLGQVDAQGFKKYERPVMTWVPARQAARVRSVDDIKATVLKYHHGQPVTIGQVADVVLAGAPKRGTASEGVSQ